MKKNLNLLFVSFRDIIMLATFILAIVLEHPARGRLLFMLAIFAGFMVWMHLREALQEKLSAFLPYTFAADIVLLVLLDDSSKFVVNYYFNIYYFFTLIAAGLMLRHKHRLIISLCVIAAAFIKYYRLVESALSTEKPVYNIPFVFSYIFFTFMVFITVAIFFNYNRMLSEQKMRLDRLNGELKRTNALLEEKNEKIKELTIFEERNRIAREIHDSVGHNLTGLVMNLELCERLSELEPSKVKSQMAACRDIARECLAEIRKSVQALKPKSIEQLPLIRKVE